MKQDIYRIVPASFKHDIEEDVTRVHWAYLHGQLEKDVEYDIFYVKGKNLTFTEGMHDAIYAGKKCTMFLWEHHIPNQLQGLAVYGDDKEAYEYAKRCYETKAISI